MLSRSSALKSISLLRCTHRFSSNTYAVRAAIIGEANSGKSSMVNALLHRKITAVTNVEHTTRRAVDAVLTEGNTQLVFTDTPGVLDYREAKRRGIDRSHCRAASLSCEDCNAIVVMVDAADRTKRERLDVNVLRILEAYPDIPSMLVLNKVDLIQHKPKLLEICRTLTADRLKDEWGYTPTGGYSHFKEVFMVSALYNDGLDDVVRMLNQLAAPGEWTYDEETVTSSTMEDQVCEVIRENVINMFKHEIPWHMKQVIVRFDECSDGSVILQHRLLWPRRSQKRVVEDKLEQLSQNVLVDLHELLGCEIHLTIHVGVQKNMTRDDLRSNTLF